MNAVLKQPARTRIKKAQIEVPQNLMEANRFIGAIGDEQRKIDAAVAICEKKIAKLKARLERVVAPKVAKRKLAVDGLFAYASANKAKLTVESKTVILTAGKFLWRWTPPAVAVENDEKMIEKLKGLGLDAYIRTIEELDRDALLADRKTLKIHGLRFTRREDFVVVPDGISADSEIKKSRTIDASEID